MCGLSGWQIKHPLSDKFKPQAQAFTLSQAHRGPDSTGYFHSDDGEIYLGHNRLSIIDLSDSGNQPMYSSAGDVMILNGEIYNFTELRRQLEELGHGFESQSDSEVVLRGFIEWGVDLTAKIRGMYSIAIWSAKEKTLHLLRDPLGIKPLYYWQLPEEKGVAFASEVRSFLSLSEFEPKISSRGLNQYIEFGYSIDPTQTIFRDIKKVQPGHRLEVRNGFASEQIRFYSPELSNFSDLKDADIEQRLYDSLSQVVKEHLVADVPVGLLLSGGLDSSLIAAIASKHEPIHTYSMGFANSNIDERPFARIVSEHINSTHHEILMHADQVMDNIDSVSAHFDDIFDDWGLVSTQLLYKACHDQGIKVVLVGEGSDELFGGYSIFRDVFESSSNNLEWQIFQLYRNYAGRRYGRQYFKFRSLMKDHLASCGGDMFKAVQLFESRSRLPNNYVMKVDKASMSVSVEARTPFLDSRIADIAYRIPKELLLNDTSEKNILKSIASRYSLLPDEIISRRKYGASIATSWMDESPEFRAYARDIILANGSVVDKIGLRTAMTQYFDQKKIGFRFPHPLSVFENIAWRVLILNIWSKSVGVSI